MKEPSNELYKKALLNSICVNKVSYLINFYEDEIRKYSGLFDVASCIHNVALGFIKLVDCNEIVRITYIADLPNEYHHLFKYIYYNKGMLVFHLRESNWIYVCHLG